MCGYIFLFVGIVSFVQKIYAAGVVINEFSSNTAPDWVELYNTSGGDINLQDWSITDTTNSIYEFSNIQILPTAGFCVVNVSNRLNNDGDRIQLFQGSLLQDCVSYGDGNGSYCGTNSQSNISFPSSTSSATRKSDGVGAWTMGSPTSGYSNTATVEPTTKVLCYDSTPTSTPTSTPRPAATSTPTRTPTPTKTPTPALTPNFTPTPTKTPTPTLKPTSIATKPIASVSAVLGATDSAATASVMADRETKYSVKPLIISLLLVGIGCAILSLVFVWKKRDALKPPESS